MKARHLIPLLFIGLSAVWAGEREDFDFGWTFKYFGPGTPDEPPSSVHADCCQNGHPAAHAVDGDKNTRWCAVDAKSGHMIKLLPNSTKAVSKLEILWENGKNKTAKIILTPVSGPRVVKNLKVKSRTSSVDIGGKKLAAIDIVINGTEEGNWASINEIVLKDAQGHTVPLAAPEQAGNAPAKPDYKPEGFRSVQLPHDWAIESPYLPAEPNETGKLPWHGYGWYRKHFEVPADFDAGKDRYYLDFDGVMANPKVYVNGELAGQWAYGYNSFRVDMTPYLQAGKKNLVAVVASNKLLSTRWYPGAGIYRHVWLEKTGPTHIAQWGVYVTTPQVSEESATVEIKTTVENTGDKAASVTVKQSIGSAKAEPAKVRVEPGGSEEVTQTITLKKPKLWSCEQPHLYKVKTQVLAGGKEIDSQETRIGVRTIEWKPDGFYLNGKRVQLNGVCEHHDLGPLGAAFHERAYERKIEKLKAMGCNSIRMTHNPPAPGVLDLCDKHGILVMDELFDIWKHQKYDKVNGYHRFWPEWWRKDVRNFVLRDRNHPCIIAWSGGNEIPEITTKDGVQINTELRDEFRLYDTTRPYTAGVNAAGGARNGFGDVLDVFGFNYKPWMYKDYSNDRPNKPFYASETASCVATRDTYFFPLTAWSCNGGGNAFKLSQVSAYGIFAPSWGYCPDVEFRAQDQSGKVAGEYVWTGFDYIGEPTPYNQDASNIGNFKDLPEAERKAAMEMMAKMGGKSPSRSSYFGIIDLAGFPKDTYYLYQSKWAPEVKQAHILPHWNWKGREGQVTPVMVFSSGDEAELFLNGKSQGVVKKGSGENFGQARLNFPKNTYRFVWPNVKYQPGELKVVVKKDGKVWATAKRVTAGAAKAVKVDVDRAEIAGDGHDLSFIELAVVDAKGNVVPTDCRKVKFGISGPATLVGFCNGNPIDHTCMQATTQEFFNGRIVAVVRSQRGQSGPVTVTISAKDLPENTVQLNVKPAPGKN